jgi:anti-anti-sigma regulatory factor
MAQDDVRGPVTDIHVADWTIVHVGQDLDAARASALHEHIAPMLVPGAHVAVDLRRSTVSADAVPVLRDLVDRGSALGTAVVVVEPRGEVRETLRAAGLGEVHESLDAAVHDLAAAHGGTHRAGLASYPAASDASTVAAEDLLGTDPRA